MLWHIFSVKHCLKGNSIYYYGNLKKQASSLRKKWNTKYAHPFYSIHRTKQRLAEVSTPLRQKQQSRSCWAPSIRGQSWDTMCWNSFVLCRNYTATENLVIPTSRSYTSTYLIKVSYIIFFWCGSRPSGSVCCGSNGQIHRDYRNPVEKKGWHVYSLSKRGQEGQRGPNLCLDRLLLLFWAHYMDDGPHLLCTDLL